MSGRLKKRTFAFWGGASLPEADLKEGTGGARPTYFLQHLQTP